MKRSMGLITLVGAAAAAYFLDPKRGHDRRAMVKNKVAGAVNSAKHKFAKESNEIRDYASARTRQFTP
jgi:gas vesicle protein